MLFSRANGAATCRYECLARIRVHDNDYDIMTRTRMGVMQRVWS